MSDKLVCPMCERESFRFIPIGDDTSIDSIGVIDICVTESGAYFHGNRGN